MSMTESVYNIIWADDEILDILSESKEAAFEKNGIKVLRKLNRSENLIETIEELGSKLHAVIVDANFSEDEGMPESDRDVSGLSLVRVAINTYRDKIPFILYSQRDSAMLKQSCPWITKEFTYGENWLDKAVDRKTLIATIKAQIEKYNSPEFRVRCQYRKEFEAAELIPGAEKLLTDGLLYEYNGNWESTEDYFNPTRNLVECVFNRGRENGILPSIPELNKMARFCSGEEIDGFKLYEAILPDVLKKCLKYFLDITNDGSHSRYDLSLKVREYVRENQNINLYRSILYIAMDILLWYSNLEKERDGMGVPWTVNFMAKGPLVKKEYGDGLSVYSCGEYALQYDKSLEDSVGREVLIRPHEKELDTEERHRPLGLQYFCKKKYYDLLDE